MLTADQNAALDALASIYQDTPHGVALQALRAEYERLRVIEAAALEFVRNGRYGPLLAALQTLHAAQPPKHEPIH